jgi:hypothetical protein
VADRKWRGQLLQVPVVSPVFGSLTNQRLPPGVARLVFPRLLSVTWGGPSAAAATEPIAIDTAAVAATNASHL